MYSQIKNPWPELVDSENYCLKDDFEIINAFNDKEKIRKKSMKTKKKI